MGEAKRRKQNDPLYGRVPKIGRGIIISSNVKIEGNKLSSLGGTDGAELRRAVLFWDRIVHPNNSAIGLGGGPDEEFLIEEGILTRPYTLTHPVSGNTAQLYKQSHINALRMLDDKEPGLWSLSETPSSFFDNDPFFKSDGGALIELYNVIPMPTGDIPLADLLEFRSKRIDEVQALTQEISQMLVDIKGSSDTESALKEKIARLEQSCADMLKVAKESKLPFRLGDWKVNFTKEFDSGNLLQGGGLGMFLGETIGMPIAGAVVGAASAALRFKVGITASLVARAKSSKSASPFRFVASLHSQPI